MHSVTAKLNKDASEFAAGDSTGFGIRLGEQNYNRKTKQKEWTNYQAAIFAKDSRQIDFYREALVSGSVVTVGGTGLIVDTYNGNNGQVITLEIQDAKLLNVFRDNPQGQASHAPAQNSHAAQPAQQERYSAPPPNMDSFDDDLPF